MLIEQTGIHLDETERDLHSFYKTKPPHEQKQDFYLPVCQCSSLQCCNGCGLLSFLSVGEILAPEALLPVHVSCFVRYCRDQDKQKIKV